jgi:hypothetical protein
MGTAPFFTLERLTGAVLIASFISFAIGGTLPILGEKGTMRIFNLPVSKHLRAVATNALVWRWANVWMGAAAVILLAGLSMLTTLLDAANERVLSRLGLVGWLVATVLWVIFSAFRGIFTVAAAEEMNAAGATGGVPAYYQPIAQWGSALFSVSAVIGFLALAAYGASLLQVELVPAWAAWATILFSLALLAQLLVMGDTLPAFHYLPPVLIGVVLMLRG